MSKIKVDNPVVELDGDETQIERVLLNLANNGQSWLENGIRYEQVIQRIGPPIKAARPRNGGL